MCSIYYQFLLGNLDTFYFLSRTADIEVPKYYFLVLLCKAFICLWFKASMLKFFLEFMRLYQHFKFLLDFRH